MTNAEIRALRSRLGLTQHDLGELIGKAARTVMAYEAGTRNVPKSVQIILGETKFRNETGKQN